MDSYTGVKVVHASKDVIDTLYTDGSLEVDLFDGRLKLRDHQNIYVVLTNKVEDEKGNVLIPSTSSAITRVIGDRLVKLSIQKDTLVGGIRPRNKEQQMALDALTDDSIKALTLTGMAGTGKTLLALAAGLHKIDQKIYDRIILTRPMTQVGRHDLGILPGEVNDKFGPYLQNYMCNMEFLLKGGSSNKRSMTDIQAIIEHYKMEFIPLQLIRGASWPGAFILADEVQTLNYHEMLTLGTRVGEDSKLVIMGDLAQRDEKIAKDRTGIWKFANSEMVQRSQLTAHIELIKCERSEIAKLFSDVFEDI